MLIDPQFFKRLSKNNEQACVLECRTLTIGFTCTYGIPKVRAATV